MWTSNCESHENNQKLIWIKLKNKNFTKHFHFVLNTGKEWNGIRGHRRYRRVCISTRAPSECSSALLRSVSAGSARRSACDAVQLPRCCQGRQTVRESHAAWRYVGTCIASSEALALVVSEVIYKWRVKINITTVLSIPLSYKLKTDQNILQERNLANPVLVVNQDRALVGNAMTTLAMKRWILLTNTTWSAYR